MWRWSPTVITTIWTSLHCGDWANEVPLAVPVGGDTSSERASPWLRRWGPRPVHPVAGLVDHGAGCDAPRSAATVWANLGCTRVYRRRGADGLLRRWAATPAPLGGGSAAADARSARTGLGVAERRAGVSAASRSTQAKRRQAPFSWMPRVDCACPNPASGGARSHTRAPRCQPVREETRSTV